MADLESFAFGDSPALADKLLDLVLIGKKTATCWAASEGMKGVEIGKRWIVKDGQGRARAISRQSSLSGGGSRTSTLASPMTRARATARFPGGGARTRPISPGEASSCPGWSSIASGSGSWRCGSASEEGWRYRSPLPLSHRAEGF
jgi:hypothetical protein